MIDWTQYATGGATRTDSFSGMNPDFNAALSQMFAQAPPDIQAQFRVGSGYRSPERQAQLWEEALQKYGSPEAARKWVAPPGKSQHGHGNAADLKYLSPEAKEWAHANAARYGLAFPLDNEDWHIELASARGGNQSGLPVTGQNALAAPQQSMPQNALSSADMWQLAQLTAPKISTLDPQMFMSKRRF